VTFALIHGSGQNAAGWERLAALLTARGHDVVAPDLPKHEPAWGIEAYADEIGRALPQDAILVGHSFSGTLLPVVATRHRCAMLVFLAAVIPEPGKSVRDQFAADPRMFSRDWIAAGPRWFDPTERDRLAREFLFHDCDEPTATWALTTLEVFDTRQLVVQPAPFSRWPSGPAASIVAGGDRTLTADWGRRAGRRAGVETIEVPGGHCPHVSRPGEIADILERLAAVAP